MSTSTHHRKKKDRAGNVLVLTAVMMIVMFALLAMAVDIGYLHVVGSELQRSADAAALSAAWELVGQGTVLGGGDPYSAAEQARAVAAEYTGKNVVGGISPVLAEGDAEIGYIRDPQTDLALDSTDPSRFNAVTVRVRRTSESNGEVPLFFARVLGFDSQGLQADATAMYINNFGGFRPPTGEGGNLMMLPFALDRQTWQLMLAGGGEDGWTWDEEDRELVSGADGVREINLFPQGTGSPGNRGTVDIGPSNNSTSDIARQILEGVTVEDMQALSDAGRSLEFDANGELFLNGDTGISAGVKDELDDIKGQPRVIPVFDRVQGPGNNAEYTITQFVGVRIVEVKLTGKMSGKRVMIQPANIVVRGGIPAATDTQKSYFVFSPVWLVR
ncbi:MAG: hypothetical protein HUU20_02490 [Pirellulales bacterium]|nr:hypothetical protein [Pirellulales bacterium]